MGVYSTTDCSTVNEWVRSFAAAFDPSLSDELTTDKQVYTLLAGFCSIADKEAVEDEATRNSSLKSFISERVVPAITDCLEVIKNSNYRLQDQQLIDSLSTRLTALLRCNNPEINTISEPGLLARIAEVLHPGKLLVSAERAYISFAHNMDAIESASRLVHRHLGVDIDSPFEMLAPRDTALCTPHPLLNQVTFPETTDVVVRPYSVQVESTQTGPFAETRFLQLGVSTQEVRNVVFEAFLCLSARKVAPSEFHVGRQFMDFLGSVDHGFTHDLHEIFQTSLGV